MTLPRDGAREESKVAGAAGSGGGQRRRNEDPAGVGVGPFGPKRAGRGGGELPAADFLATSTNPARGEVKLVVIVALRPPQRTCNP